jgi:hypothetical protein
MVKRGVVASATVTYYCDRAYSLLLMGVVVTNYSTMAFEPVLISTGHNLESVTNVTAKYSCIDCI